MTVSWQQDTVCLASRMILIKDAIDYIQPSEHNESENNI